MADYYIAGELQVIRIKTAEWVASTGIKYTDMFSYGEEVCQEKLNNLSFMVAIMEAIECYTPITLAAESGETNCLTEAQLDLFVDIIHNVTGMCFAPKGSSIIDTTPDTAVLTSILDNASVAYTWNDDAPIEWNI